MAQLTIHERDVDVVIATQPGLLVASWGGMIRTHQIQRLDTIIPALLEESPGGRYCSITIIEPSISMRFEDDARELSAKLQKRWGDHMLAQAYLVEGTGFLPAAVRGATAGLHLMTRSPYPLKVFRDVEELAEWIARAGDLAVHDVLDAVGTVRAGFD